MKRKKLELKRQTITVLNRDRLSEIGGGAWTKQVTVGCASLNASMCVTQCVTVACQTGD